MQRLLSTMFLCTAFVACVDESAPVGEQTAAEQVTAGQPVLAQAVADDPPSSGGGDALIDGAYDLIASTIYIGPGGDPSSVPATFVSERMILDDGQIKLTTTRDGATTTQTGAVTFCGAGLGLTYTSGPNAGTTGALGFTARGDKLEIYNQNTVSTYKLRAGTATGLERAATGAACKQAPGVCGGLPNIDAWVVEQSTAGTAPVGTAGALRLETAYVMESDVYYNGAPPSGARDKITLIAHADTTFEFVQEIDHQGAARLAGTYTTIGNVLTFNITCSPFGAFPLPFTYNARLGALQTIQPGGANHDTGTECMTYHAVK